MIKRKKVHRLILVAALCFTCGCSEPTAKDTQEKVEDVVQEVADQAKNIADKENENVLSVKNGYPENYPDVTFGDAFDNFFGSPTWKYFEGENGEDVVEFTGYCTYQDVEVKARLQFVLNDDGTFTSGALSFNEVPQSQLITSAMLEKAFEEYRKENEVSEGEKTEVASTVVELTDYLGEMSTDFYEQSGLELEVYGMDGWDYSGYENAIDVSEVRDASGYYITLTSRQLGDKAVSLMGIMIGDSYDDIKSLIKGTVTYTSDTVEEYQLDNGDVMHITFDAVSRAVSQIRYGHFPQMSTTEVTSSVSVYDAAGMYVADGQTMSVSIYSEETEDGSVGNMVWTHTATETTIEVILYKESDNIATFTLSGIDYKVEFFADGAVWYDVNNNMTQFEKTESYQS